jgi:hypothetical protein
MCNNTREIVDKDKGILMMILERCLIGEIAFI